MPSRFRFQPSLPGQIPERPCGKSPADTAGTDPSRPPGPPPARRSGRQAPSLWLCLYLPGLNPEGSGPDPTLVRLATGLGRYTPQVSLEPPDALLLEIGASLRLFGGPEHEPGKLRGRIARQAAAAGGCTVISAGAPTPRGALWMARAGLDGRVIRGIPALTTCLSALPVQCLGWPGATRKLLEQMGIGTLGECMRLPRQGLARRLGPASLLELDQGFGRAPEPRRPFLPPVRFRETLELPADAAAAGLLLDGFAMLLARLGDRLVAHQASVQVLWCQFCCAGNQSHWLRLGLGRPSASVPLLLELLRFRMERETLPREVLALGLQADLVAERGPEGADLLGSGGKGESSLPVLLDRLRARLGSPAVYGIGIVPEHRPERAWQPIEDPVHRRQAPDASRESPFPQPPWLLPEPRRLGLSGGQPVCGSVLTLERGPQRIETGWWDGADVRRDYYLGTNRRGCRYWVYQDLHSRHWFLHGVFG